MRTVHAVLGLLIIAPPACSQSPRTRTQQLPDLVVDGSRIKPYQRRFQVYKTPTPTPEDMTPASDWDLGTLDDRLDVSVQDGDTVLVRIRHLHVIGAETFDTSVYDRRTLALRTDRWHSDRHSQGYDVRGARLSYFYQRSGPNAIHVTTDTTLHSPSFHLDATDLVLQAILPTYDLHRAFKLPTFYYSPTAEELEQWTLGVRVTARERLRLETGEERETWVLEMSNGDTYWLDVEDRQPLMWRVTEESQDVLTYRYVGRSP